MTDENINSAANSVLSFLQNIELTSHARDFCVIAVESLETGARHRGEEFDKKAVLSAIRETDQRIKQGAH